MLNFDRYIVREPRKFIVQRFYKGHGVPDSIEKIRITKRDVLGSRGDLLADIFEDDFAIYYAENAFVDGDNRAVPAEMLASPARFRVARDAVPAGTQHDMGVLCERCKPLPVRWNEFLPGQRDRELGLLHA